MKKILFVLAFFGWVSCEPSPIDPNNPDNYPPEQTGTLVVDFPITHNWLPVKKIIRTDLHVALTEYDMYREKFIQSANVIDSQQKYSFFLTPGNYFLEAAIACLCEGDSCSAGGFPGNKWGQKHVSYAFSIAEGLNTEVIIRFLQ